MKTCTKCTGLLPPSSFYKLAISKDGLAYECKQCTNARNSAYVAANKALVRTRKAAWVAANKDRVAAKRTAHYLANKESCNIRSRRHYLANRETYNEKSRAYQLLHKARLKVLAAAYRQQHIEQEKQHHKAYYKANKAHVRQQAIAWRAANIDLDNKSRRAAARRRIAAVVDSYAKQKIQRQVPIPAAHIPAPLIEAKREQLLFQRSLKETKRVIKKHFTDEANKPTGHGRPKPDANRRITNGSSAHNDGRSTRRG